MRPFEFLKSIRYKLPWEQRSLWRTYVWDIGGLSEEEKASLQDEILNMLNRESDHLAQSYVHWYPKGALKQAQLDREAYCMLFLLHYHTIL